MHQGQAKIIKRTPKWRISSRQHASHFLVAQLDSLAALLGAVSTWNIKDWRDYFSFHKINCLSLGNEESLEKIDGSRMP